MPKIEIKEKDLTLNSLLEYTDNYILMVDSKLNSGTTPKVLTTKECAVDKFCKKVDDLGGHIIAAKDWTQAKDYCKDRNQFNVKFILCNEVEGEATADPIELTNALEIATARKDCAVIYTKITTTFSEKEKAALKKEVPYKSGFFDDEKRTEQGKYVIALYGNIHEKNDLKSKITAGQGYILAFLNNISKGAAEWWSVAGSKRGEIPGYVVDDFIKESEIDDMQSRTTADSIAINPIVNMNPYGTRIWGIRTCLPNVLPEGAKEGSDLLVATSFANIRIALCDIKKQIYQAGRSVQFEQDTDVLWVNFKSKVNSLLEEMKSSYGIVGYRWYRDKQNEKRAELRAVLQIVPVEAVEDIYVSVELKDELGATTVTTSE